MKSFIIILAIFFFSVNSVRAKIINREGVFFIDSGAETIPMLMVNELIQKKKISQIILYAQGDVHLVSFAKEGGATKLYSVDSQGFIYDLEPFANYEVKKINTNGTFEFKQRPGVSFHVSSKGFYLH